MFPGFFIGTMFLFMLVRAVFGGHHRYGFRRGWAWHGPWEGRYAGERTEWLWGDDPWDVRARGRSRSEPPRAPDDGRIKDAIHEFVRSLSDKLGATAEQERAFAAAIERLRSATSDALREVHDVLDERQRELLATLIGRRRSQ
jgi:hypothetical protein